ncbi:hypothetical protein V8C86DRAFT_2537140 [Haematococcus lacustris]
MLLLLLLLPGGAAVGGLAAVAGWAPGYVVGVVSGCMGLHARKCDRVRGRLEAPKSPGLTQSTAVKGRSSSRSLTGCSRPTAHSSQGESRIRMSRC